MFNVQQQSIFTGDRIIMMAIHVLMIRVQFWMINLKPGRRK